ncbi:hypothetical protein ACF0H5_005539 [Mactra antiquata]
MIQLFLLTFLFTGSSGSDVVLGVVGKSAFIECKLPVSNMLAWEAKDGFIIAVDGKVTNENSTKYVIEDHGTLRESLVVRDLTLNDETSYRCFYLNNSTMYDVTKLNVLELQIPPKRVDIMSLISNHLLITASPTTMNITSPQHDLIEGTTVNFTCEADGGKPLPDIDWFITYHDGIVAEMSGVIEDTTYANGTGYRVNTLTLNITRDLYGATISCNISVSILFKKTFTVNSSLLLVPGQPVISGYNGSFDENTLKSFECFSNGSLPTASIYWLLDGRGLGDVEVVVIPEVNGTFSVLSQFSRIMSRDYNGSVLTCAVTNTALEYRRLPPLMTNVTLLAAYKPHVTRVQKEYLVEENSNVTMSCYITGNPLPKFDDMYWTHEDTVIDRKYYTLSNDSDVFSLVLNHIDTFNAGNFSCHATNRLGKASSGPIQLKVLYAPRCRLSTVEKYAVWMGKSVKLNCNMESVPNNVLLTWRYEISEEIILANQSTTNLADNDTITGSLDLFVRLQSQYKTVVCYGRNSIGISTKPCRFHIIPPGPPEAPSNCSVETINALVNIKCNTGFDGGSKQHFVLQKFVNSMYETIQQTDEPLFNFVTYQNTTVRICSYNDEYSLTQTCAAPISVTVNIADLPHNDQQKGDNSHSTAYIAGGVVAALIVIITIVIVVLLLRRYKKDLFIKSEDKVTRNQTSRKYVVKEWWKQKISKRFFTKESEPTISSVNPSVRTGETVVDIESNDVPYQDIVTLASEPKYTLQFKHLVSTPRLDVSTHRKVSPSNVLSIHTTLNATDDACIEIEQVDEAPNVLSESTGLFLSPIRKESPIVHSEELGETLSILKTASYDKTGDEIGKSYNTNDMLEGLCSLQDSVNDDFSKRCEETRSFSKTLEQDYTCRDIDDALDRLSKETDTDSSRTKSTEAINLELSDNAKHMTSEVDTVNNDISEAEMRSSKTTASNDNTEAITSDLFEDKDCHGSENVLQPLSLDSDCALQDTYNDSVTVLHLAGRNLNVSASMFNNFSSNCENSVDEPVVQRPLQKSFEESRTNLKKSNSLPYRCNTRRQNVLKKTNSAAYLRNDRKHQSGDSTTFQLKNICDSDLKNRVSESEFQSNDRKTTPHSSISKNGTDITEVSTLSEDLVCHNSELTMASVDDSYDVKEMEHFKPKEMSSPTDQSEVLYDIHAYTLTLDNSVDDHTESNLNFTDKSYVTNSSLQDIDAFTLTITSELSDIKDEVRTVDDEQEITPQQAELAGDSVSLDNSVVYEYIAPRVCEIRRSGSFMEAMNNSSALESEDSFSPRRHNSLTNTETECSYVNHGFELDGENCVANVDEVKQISNGTEQNVDNVNDSTLNDSNQSVESTSSDFYI